MNVAQRFDNANVGVDVMSSELPDGGSVLLNLESELYFGLNAVGSVLWNSLQAGKTYELTVSELLEQFDVDRARIDADVEALLNQLDAKGLLDGSNA